AVFGIGLFVLGLFIGGFILKIFSLICKGNTDYEANIRVSASLAILLVVSGLSLLMEPLLNLTMSTVVSLLIYLYGMYLLYIALTHALSARAIRAKVLTIIMATFWVLVSVFSIIVTKKMADVIDSPEMQKLVEVSKEKMSEDDFAEFEKVMQKFEKIKEEVE
ncbi:MAG TPA: hypothetical protein VMW66_03790, partial [Elusimicrobiales bacterium]|nr:hypothetical protein [Elusimicrobiales bacterium]